MRIVPLGGLGQIGRNMNVLASLKKSSWASWLQALALTATGGEGASRSYSTWTKWSICPKCGHSDSPADVVPTSAGFRKAVGS